MRIEDPKRIGQPLTNHEGILHVDTEKLTPPAKTLLIGVDAEMSLAWGASLNESGDIMALDLDSGTALDGYLSEIVVYQPKDDLTPDQVLCNLENLKERYPQAIRIVQVKEALFTSAFIYSALITKRPLCNDVFFTFPDKSRRLFKFEQDVQLIKSAIKLRRSK